MTGPGLARFVEPGPGSLGTGPAPGAGEIHDEAGEPERCELCSAGIPAGHNHLVDLESRSLLCACRACALLFANPGSGGGRYRPVPGRFSRVQDFKLTEREWEDLQIPVSVAYFFLNSLLGRWVAFYPSPAGATESVLSLDAWAGILDGNPGLAGVDPDVEALLVRCSAGRFECYVVPIDACYELVGLVRLHWKGFDGGAEVHAHIAEFFAGLEARAAGAGDPA